MTWMYLFKQWNKRICNSWGFLHSVLEPEKIAKVEEHLQGKKIKFIFWHKDSFLLLDIKVKAKLQHIRRRQQTATIFQVNLTNWTRLFSYNHVKQTPGCGFSVFRFDLLTLLNALLLAQGINFNSPFFNLLLHNIWLHVFISTNQDRNYQINALVSTLYIDPLVTTKCIFLPWNTCSLTSHCKHIRSSSQSHWTNKICTLEDRQITEVCVIVSPFPSTQPHQWLAKILSAGSTWVRAEQNTLEAQHPSGVQLLVAPCGLLQGHLHLSTKLLYSPKVCKKWGFTAQHGLPGVKFHPGNL